MNVLSNQNALWHIVSSNHTQIIGWCILCTLLTQRLIKCGAGSTVDLDSVRATLIYRQNETYHDFYQRCRSVECEYELQYGEERLIPKIKIVSRYVDELSRCQDYMPFLISYQNILSDNFDQFNGQDYGVPIPFTLKKVYTHLTRCRVPDTPTSTLRPSVVPVISPQTQIHNAAKKEYGPSIIASVQAPYSDAATHTTHLDQPIDTINESTSEDSVIDPTIHAFYCRQRDKCQVCLIGNHNPDECFL